MTFRTLSITLATAASLLSLGALADDDRDESGRFGRRTHASYSAPHQHDQHCQHAATPPPGRPAGYYGYGRYVLQNVNRWQDGYSTQIWVPEQCRTVRRNHRKPWKRVRTVCEPAHYESRWIEGRWVTTQEWVWVRY